MTKALRLTTLLLALAGGAATLTAQTFTVATLNTDGLPENILLISVNPDGPHARYTPAISRYLADRAYDIIGVQENFNYNEALGSALLGDYTQDAFSGGIFASGSWLNPLNLQFPCDGLSLFLRKPATLDATTRVAWTQNNGKVDHSNDDLCAKGFRRYELTLSSGTPLRLYNMHMDASTDADEAARRDGPDRQCRQKQWAQLRNDILDHLDDTPVIVLGDMNSYYARDEVKATFIDAITETGRATVADAWIELARNGEYPAHEDGPVMHDDDGWLHQGEALDKILYINPTGQPLRLRPVSVEIDRTGYVRDDGTTPLGDHFPLAATFIIEDATAVATIPSDPDAHITAIFTPDGRRHTRLQRGVNILRMSDGTTRKIHQ